MGHYLTAEFLDSIGATLDTVLEEFYGKRMGFALFTFPIDGEGDVGEWVSNGERKDMIKFMREITDRLEAGQDIERPIGEA